MPFLSGLLEESRWGELVSTFPPLTPSAWASMVTGCNPGAHGLLDYLTVEEDHCVRPVSSSDWKRSPVWELAGRDGARSVRIVRRCTEQVPALSPLGGDPAHCHACLLTED